tara:strand:- start:147 stop:3311 length:3165 start_codon:yes stop_codon:yes gene_type:complete
MAIREKANNAALNGGVTEIAGNPNEIEVAGIGNKIFKLLFNNVDDMAPSISKADDTLPSGVAPRSPTTIEESFLAPKKQSYTKTKDYHAKRMLSKEGYARFKQQNMEGKENLKTTEDQEVLDMASKALKDKEIDAPYADSRIAPENSYDNIKTLRNKEGVLHVSSKDGTDFNFDKIETSDDVKEIINAISDEIAGPITKAKRGKISHIETKEEAEKLLLDEIGLTKKLFNRKIGDTFNNTELTAVRLLMVSSLEKLNKLTKQIEANKIAGIVDSKLLLQYRRQTAINAGILMQVKGSITEGARAFNSLKIPVGLPPQLEGAAIKELLSSAGGEDYTIKMALGWREAYKNGNHAAHNYSHQGWWGTSKAVFNEIYVNGLLGWTTTILKNIIATPAFQVYQSLEEILASGFSLIERNGRKVLKKPGVDEGVFLREIAAKHYGQVRGIRDMFVVANKTFKTEIPAMGGAKAENLQYQAVSSERIKWGSTKLNELNNPVYGQAVDRLGRTIRLPGRSLQSGDDFWKTGLQRGELHRQAFLARQKALASGKSLAEADEAAMMIHIDPRSVQKELIEAAEYSTLTSPLPKSIKTVLNSIQRHPLGRVAIPFSMVPTNAVIRHAERNPIMAAFNPTFYGKLFMRGPRERARAFSQLALGTSTMLMVADYAMEGRCTGSYPRNKKQQNMLPPGWQPYSCVFRAENFPKDENGDDLPLYNELGNPNGELFYVNYSGLEPVGAVLAVGADTVERQRRSDNPDVNKTLAMSAVAATANYFTELPFLQTMGDVTKAFMYEDMSYLTEGPLSNTIGPIPIPFSAAQKRFAKLENPKRTKISKDYEYYTWKEVVDMGPDETGEYQYDKVGTIKGGNYFTEFMDNTWKLNTKDSLIFGSSESEAAEAVQYDVFGDEIDNSVRFSDNAVLAAWNMITPFKISIGEKMTPLQEELKRIGMPLQNKKTKLLNRIPLSEKQISQWTLIAKKEQTYKVNGKYSYNFIQALEYITNTGDYRNASIEKKFSMVNNIEEKFYEEALPTLLSLPGNEELFDVYYEVKDIKENINQYIK